MYKTKNIEKWLGYDFEPVECRTGKDFTNFSRNLKAEIEAQLKGMGYTLARYTKGYFIINGFIHNEKNGKYLFFSVDDVRFSKNWHKDILIREARNEKDYRGGYNQYTSLENFGESAMRILESTYSQLAA